MTGLLFLVITASGWTSKTVMRARRGKSCKPLVVAPTPANFDNYFARKDLTDYFWEYNDVRRMNTITNANVKCVATLESGSGLDKYGQSRIGSKTWFFRSWKILDHK
jgi:hypothetical protein